MFDRAPSSRRAKSWQPDPGLLSRSRGFATSRWGDNDDGFMVDDIKRTKDGFALDEYAQVPLSPQAIQALKRLKAMEPDENVVIADEVFEAPEKFQIEKWNANAHLPFVVDAYDFDDEDIGQNMAHVETTDVAVEVSEQKTLTQTEDAEADTASAHDAQTQEDAQEAQDAQMASPAVDASIAEDTKTEAEVSTAADAEKAIEVAEAVNAEAVNAQAATAEAATAEAVPVAAKSKVDVGSDAKQAAEVDAELETSTESEQQVAATDETPHDISAVSEHAEALAETANESAPESVQALKEDHVEAAAPTADEAEWVESDVVDEQAVAPEQMAATVEEVVDDVTLPEPVLDGIDPEEVAQREAEKFAEGLAQGMEKGLAQGIEQGERQAREAMQQEVQAQCAVLGNVTQELQALMQNSKAFYEPMKRLALHVAEQIVMAELRTSTHAIEQLIQRCLDELDHPAQGLVVVELNPDDKARLQAQSPELIRGMRLEAVHDMAPGSVRLFANDAVVEDLVTHRLQALAQSMLVDVAAWQAHSALAKPAAAAHDMESDDVHP